MTVPPIDPSAVLASEWQVPSLDAAGPAGTPGAAGIDGIASPGVDGVSGAGGTESSFGNVLTEQIGKLTDLQENAASASQSLANGTATDIGSVVMAVEKAQLAMQLAGQIRTRGAEAINDIFHTQI